VSYVVDPEYFERHGLRAVDQWHLVEPLRRTRTESQRRRASEILQKVLDPVPNVVDNSDMEGAFLVGRVSNAGDY
jgi:hypothetical protein